MTQIYVITGASRGIGLEHVRQLSSQKDNIIYAGARNPEGSKELMALVDNKRVIPFTIDVNSKESIEKAVAKVSTTATNGIDVLINNAGIDTAKKELLKVTETRKEEYLRIFETNVGGVSDVTQGFLPLLRKRGSDKVKKIINMSSILGSLGLSLKDDFFNKQGPYRVSKAALNMLTELFANELEPESFVVIAIHPGWVKTDMGGGNAQLEVPDSVSQLLNTYNNLTAADNGRFLNYNGRGLSSHKSKSRL